MNKVVIITGGSSGIGYATANHFLKKGYKVYEFSRSGVSQNGVEHVTCDVTKEEDCTNAVNYVVNQSNRIDLVVNNAGFGISGAIEYTETHSAKRLFDVNFFGVHNVTKACLAHLRKTKGRVINVSSVGGVLYLPFQAFYSASKAALNALTLALRNELKDHDISVCCVMPGDVSTGFTKAREKSKAGDNGEYSGRIEKSVSLMEKDEKNGMKPEFIASKIYKIGTKKRVKPMYTLGFKYKVFVVLNKLLPARFVNWIVYLIYGE